MQREKKKCFGLSTYLPHHFIQRTLRSNQSVVPFHQTFIAPLLFQLVYGIMAFRLIINLELNTDVNKLYHVQEHDSPK